MDYSPSQKKVYLSNSSGDEATFANDAGLPKLPVPNLEFTIQKYLKSIAPFVSVRELQESTRECEKFLVSEQADQLQNLLKQRSKENENWLEDWWLRKGYLQFRDPLLPFLNIAGPFAANNPGGAWPVHLERPMENVSLFIFHLLQFWKALRQEKLKPDVSKGGVKFSMHQFRNLFNSCRIPGRTEDLLRCCWKTEREGSSPTHALVLRNGFVYVFSPISGATGEPKSPRKIKKILEEIKYLADSRIGDEVGALTCDFRERWSQNRQLLITLGNARNLEIIETALFVVILDKKRPKNDSECCWELMSGDPANRWADKSLNVIVFENGRGGVNSDHTPMDAMVNVAMSHFIDLGVTDDPGYEGVCDNEIDEIQCLKWNLDSNLLKAIGRAKSTSVEMGKNLLVKRKPFTVFGKVQLTQRKVNPDTFVQMALQLAYMRLHKRPAPTYETATTRQFLRGRTETLRSCTPELVEFCKAMDSKTETNSSRKALLLRAMKIHNQLMNEAKHGQGCDRHLFGLQSIAQDNQLPIPKLFSQRSFTASGGHGNFVLSTSTCGYTGMSGGTAPMCLDGYGAFYNFEADRIWLWVTAFRASYETSIEKFTRFLEQAFVDVFELLKDDKSKL